MYEKTNKEYGSSIGMEVSDNSTVVYVSADMCD
jgi:hypothetical protein